MSIGLSRFPEGQSTPASFNLTEKSKAVSAPFVRPAGVQPPPPLITPPDAGDVTTASFSITLNPSNWTNSDERLFSRFAVLKATKKASAKDLKTLAELQARRRLGKNPMCGEEVFFQYQRRQMESKLLKDLQEYVQFLEASRRS